MFGWHVNLINFSGGEAVQMERGSTLLIIGPNSSGKSLALRNIQSWLAGDQSPKPVAQHVGVQRTGDVADFHKWLDDNYSKRTIGGLPQYITRNQIIREDQIATMWQQHGNYLGGMNGFLVGSLDTATRTTIANYTQAIDIWNSPPSTFVHFLQTQPDIHNKINQQMQAAFGVDLIIDWPATPNVGFRVGQTPPTTAENDRVSVAYAEALQKLPKLDDDGDGIKGFAGCILATYCGSQKVLLIDEPEAFLHPPQARRLGAALASAAADSDRQVIVATHSADIVQGALNSGKSVAVCRLTRDGQQNHAAMLESSQLNALWAKPLLRSTAAIDGLFHTGVVVCEADSDVRLYDTSLRRLRDSGTPHVPDLYFTQGGGKGELATLAGAYKSLKTRSAVIADIDLLRNPAEHQRVLAALGSSLDEHDRRYRVVLNALNDAAPIRSVAEAANELREVANELETSGESRQAQRERVSLALQQSAKFSEAKRYGIMRLRGEPLALAQELLKEWKTIGLFIVPVGELEGWWPEGPASDKGRWIVEAVDQLAKPGTFQELDIFMKDLVQFFA
jgi:hypothetical protein